MSNQAIKANENRSIEDCHESKIVRIKNNDGKNIEVFWDDGEKTILHDIEQLRVENGLYFSLRKCVSAARHNKRTK